MSDKNIYQLISEISVEAGAIELTQKSGVPFPFRGIDTTVNHLAPLLQKHGVIVVPNVVQIEVTPKDVGNRTVKTTSVVTAFTFYAPDGSSLTATTAGLADDFGDRSTAQAQSVAFRVALLQTFTLPTQTKDPEESGQETQDGIEAAKATAPATKPATKAVEAVADIRKAINAKLVAPNSPYTGEIVNALGNEISGKTPNEWGKNLTVLKKILEKMDKGELPSA